MFSILAFVVGVVVGAFSHKYLARKEAAVVTDLRTGVATEVKKV